MELNFCCRFREFCIFQFTIISALIFVGLVAYIYTYISGHDHVLGFLRLVDVGSEQSLSTYFSVINLLLAAGLLFTIYAHESKVVKPASGYWLFLSILFLFLSIDESAGIHEKFGNLHEYMVRMDFIEPMLDTHQWIPFGVIFVICVFVILLPFLRSLPTKTRNYFLIAGTVFVTGAIGFEFLGAYMLKSGFVDSPKEMIFFIRRLFEEGFEMYGIAIFNCALYREFLVRRIRVIVGD